MLNSATGMQAIYKHAMSTVQEDIGKLSPTTGRRANGHQDGEALLQKQTVQAGVHPRFLNS
jgi:hypothetical protein